MDNACRDNNREYDDLNDMDSSTSFTDMLMIMQHLCLINNSLQMYCFVSLVIFSLQGHSQIGDLSLGHLL